MNLQTTLTKFAKQDIKIAKKSGIVCVTDTKEGNIEITFENETFTFSTLWTSNNLGQFSEKEAVKKLASLYQVAA